MKRQRNAKHLAWIRERPCCVCMARQDVVPHHLLTGPEPRSMSLKASDRFTLPLCPACHDALHHLGDEEAFFADYLIDPVQMADWLWSRSPANKVIR